MADEIRAQRPNSLLWIAAIVVFALAAWRFVAVSGEQLRADYDVLYETPNLRTIQLIERGDNVYSPEVYDAAPFWITLYTPLYHHVVALLPNDAANPYLRGREVALGCMLLAAASLFLAGRRSLAIALVGVGAFLFVRPVTQNAALLKNDTLGLVFSVAAIFAVRRAATAARAAKWIALAALACAAAIASKQSFASAPVAGVLFLALVDRKRAIAFALAAFGAIAAFVVYARVAWGPGFTFSVFEALQNPISWSQFSDQWSAMLVQPTFDLVLASFVLLVATRIVRDDWRSAMSSPFALYGLVSFAVVVATVGKLGSNTNYFVEPTLAALLFLVDAASIEFERVSKFVQLAVGLVLCASIAEVAVADKPSYACAGYPDKERMQQGLALAAQKITALGNPNPRVLNLSAAYFAYPLPGEIDVNDPFLYMHFLWANGKLSTAPIVAMLQKSQFDGVLAAPGLRPNRGPFPMPELFNALFANYRPAFDAGAFEYWTRASKSKGH